MQAPAPQPAPAPSVLRDAQSIPAAPAPSAAAPAPAPAAPIESRTRAPDPFPAQAQWSDRRGDAANKPDATSKSSAPAGAAADPAQAGQRQEKPSLLSEPAEYRANTQPLPEVRDSAPTYPNEQRPSIPLPNTYLSPPRQAREPVAGAGTVTGSVRAPSTAAAVRKEEALQKRGAELAPPPSAPPSLSAAAAPRDPAEWIKAILKLRSEGKNEQVLKELAEFRKLHPAYPLPDELKPFAAAK
jgi:hypothetical protein